PTRLRYVIAESEQADHQISRSACGSSSAERTFRSVRCWPAKLASAPSSSTAEERTASGPPSGRTVSTTVAIASSSSEATASTSGPASAKPGGTGRPSRTASPSPTAFDPNTEVSETSASGIRSLTGQAAPAPAKPAPPLVSLRRAYGSKYRHLAGVP